MQHPYAMLTPDLAVYKKILREILAELFLVFYVYVFFPSGNESDQAVCGYDDRLVWNFLYRRKEVYEIPDLCFDRNIFSFYCDHHASVLFYF